MAMRRCCDWCAHNAQFAFHVPPDAGAMTQLLDPIVIDFCESDTANAFQHLLRITAHRPYPAEVSVAVIDA